METRAKFHLSWVYTFSAMLSSLRNWANHDRYPLRDPAFLRNCVNHQADCNHFQNDNHINLGIIRPSTFNRDRKLRNWLEVFDETTWLAGFSLTQRFDFDLYETV